ncbi:MAG: hypothetical protein E7645_02865 [Ruminococcaceae bacterium]|nr:hypothetical protein [Oscillospiraceae bacterium]
MKKFLALLLAAMMVLSCFAGMTFTISAEETTEPTEPTGKNLIIPQDQWVISGHMPQIVTPDHATHGGMVAAGGVESAALLHQGSIGLGEIDLAKYSKVIIYWGSDASQVTIDAYNANANNRFALVNADKNSTMSPDESTIIAAATYELHGWNVEPFEIDLTGVDYNGPVFLTHDSLPGGFALIYSIEFVYDEVYEKENTTDCTFAYDFSKYSENVTADIGFTGSSGVSVENVAKSGYVTFDSSSADPFFSFATAPGIVSTQADYAVIKYRTSVENAGGEFFATRSDGVSPGQAGSNIQFNYIGDGQWHTVIVDATEIWGNVKDVTLTGMRYDPLRSTGLIDVSYIKFFATLEGAEACVASETKEVTLSGEYIDGDDAIIMVGGGAYAADKWIKLGIGTGPATQNFPGNANDFSICADNVRYSIGGTQTDWCTETGHLYMASINSQIKDANSEYEYISFRGWANPKIGGLEIAEFGYAINDQEPVFNASFAIDEPSLNEAIGSAAARRYDNIIIPTAGLADGVYNIYLLVKDTNGVIYNMNGSWGGDFVFIKGNASVSDSDYPYVDADGNGYTVRADGVLFDAKGFDTGMHLFTDDEGTPYGAAHYFQLEYQDPAAGAIDIDGTKYTYTTKVTLAPKMEPVDPENELVTATYDSITTHVSTDTIYIGSTIVASGPEVPVYIIAANSILRDTDKVIESMTFRGWIGHNDSPAAQFGYAFDAAEPIWGEFKEATEDPVLAAGGGPNSQRFAIKVDISSLSDGKHSLYLLVKYEDGTIVAMNNIWTDLIIVKGGSWKQVGYIDGTDTYVKNEDGTVSINGEVATGKMLINDNDATYYDGVAALDENAKGKYLYNVTLTYTVDPEIPVNPAELKPVYLIDGEMLNVSGGQGIADATYDYEGGYITYTATAADPNTHGQNFVPAGTILGRYLVLKYRTSSEKAQGECFVGTSAGASGPDNVRYPAYVTDGEWHTLIADLSVSKEWSADGLTNHFRNDILIDKGHSIDIEYYAFFNTLKEATYYAENDCHVLPKAPVYYTITFKADGEIVKEITILEGTTSVKAPAVPAKEGFTGAWEEYTITGDADQTINAVYTAISGGDEQPGEDPDFKIDDPSKLTSFPESVYTSYFPVNNANQTEIIFNEDGSVTFKGTWDAETSPVDPFVTFSYSNLLRKYVDNKLQNVPNKKGEYGVVVLKVKADASIAGNFKLYYAMGRNSTAWTEDCAGLADYDAEGTGDYEYIIFDFTYTDILDDVIGSFRFDWADGIEASEDNIGASLTLYEINLYKDMDEAMIACGMETPTEPNENKPTEPVATQPTATEPQATQPAGNDVEEDKGCGSVIASASVMTIAAAACALVVLKKKKED